MNAKCLMFEEFGRPKDVLKIVNKEIEKPQDHEVLVRMLARPINPSDLIPITGAYAHRITLPNIPGYEGVGIVEEAGTYAKHLIGKRVLPLRGEGTWQDFVKTSAAFAVPIPDFIDHFTAAQMYINPVTALVTCKEILKLKQNDVLLVNACGSSIGHIFAQLSRVLGFRLIAVTRNNKYTEALLQYGASAVIDSSAVPLRDTVMDLTNGKGADAAIDSIGDNDGNDLAFCVRQGGNFLTIGLLSGKQVNWSYIVQNANINVNMFHLRHWNSNISIHKWQEVFNQLISLVENRSLSFKPADRTYSLIEIRNAIDAVESPKEQKGKVFLT